MGDTTRDISAHRTDGVSERAEPCFTLLKGRHAWVFRCAAGDEKSVLRAARAISARPGSGLDRFDVAALAMQVSRRQPPRAPTSTG